MKSVSYNSSKSVWTMIALVLSGFLLIEGFLISIQLTLFDSNEDIMHLVEETGMALPQLNAVFASTYEILAESKDTYLDLFNQKRAKFSNILQAWNHQITLPKEIEKYEVEKQKILFESLCKEPSCKNELLDNGLESISIFIIENCRKIVNQLQISNFSEDTARTLMRSIDVKNLESLLTEANKAYWDLFEFLEHSIEEHIEQLSIQNQLYFGIWALVLIAYTVILNFTVIAKLTRINWQTRGMLNIIPLRIIRENPEMRAQFLRKKENKKKLNPRRVEYRE